MGGQHSGRALKEPTAGGGSHRSYFWCFGYNLRLFTTTEPVFLDVFSFCAFFRSFMLVPLYSRTRLFWIEEIGLVQMLIYT